MNNYSNPTKHTILSAIQQSQDQIKALGVRRLGLFGSFARDQAGPDSDVDVLVEFEPGYKTFDRFIHLVFLLEDLFQRPVELVTDESLSPYLRPYILEEVEYVPLVA